MTRLMKPPLVSPVFSSIWRIDEKTALNASYCVQSFAPMFRQGAKGTPALRAHFSFRDEKCGLEEFFLKSSVLFGEGALDGFE